MKKSMKQFLGLYGLALIVACNSAGPNENQQKENVELQTATPKTINLNAGYGDYVFKINGVSEADSCKISISHKGTDYEGESITFKMPGMLKAAFSTDVNENYKPELYIYTSFGERKFGYMKCFEFAKSLGELNAPALKTEYAEGYAGLDTFYIKQNHLIRSFPVFDINGVDYKETGIQRTLWYSLDEKGNFMLIN